MTPSQIIPFNDDNGEEEEEITQPLLLPSSKRSKAIMRPHSYRSSPSMARSFFKYLISAAVIIFLVVAIVFLYFETQIVPENYLGYQASKSKLGIYDHAAVTTDTVQCSAVGTKILKQGGSAIDAAIASLSCMAVVIPESSGPGGGCFITYYHFKDKKSYVINARETAPSYAKDGMYQFSNQSSRGPLAIAIPGELMGLQVAHNKWGKLPWSYLFNDSIELADKGFPVSEHVATAIKNQEKYIRSDEYKLKDFFMKDGELLKEGDWLKRVEYAATLRKIAMDGAKTLYGGQVGKDLITDLTEQGGKISLDELSSYKAREEDSFVMSLSNNLTLHSVNLPASGPLLGLILNVMMRYTEHGRGNTMIKSINFFHRFAEAMKFAYAKRQLLGDPKFESDVVSLIENITSESYFGYVMDNIKLSETSNDPNYYFDDGPAVKLTRDDHGTAAMSVIDQEGNAVSIGSTINAYFGSKIISPKTGIILNNEMDDFSNPNITSEFDLPPSDHNKIEPGKIPLSSMCPTIITDADGKVVLAIGGSGGTQITTSVALVALRALFFGENIKRAVDGPRIHHQLFPMELRHEKNFNPIILQELNKKGHRTKIIPGRGSIVMALKRRHDGKLEANSDFRKGGDVDGY